MATKHEVAFLQHPGLSRSVRGVEYFVHAQVLKLRLALTKQLLNSAEELQGPRSMAAANKAGPAGG